MAFVSRSATVEPADAAFNDTLPVKSLAASANVTLPPAVMDALLAVSAADASDCRKHSATMHRKYWRLSGPDRLPYLTH